MVDVPCALEDVAREVQTILRAAEKKEADEAAEAFANGVNPDDDNDDDADPPPQEMTSDVAGDMVVMDTRVWHYGRARRLLNISNGVNSEAYE